LNSPSNPAGQVVQQNQTVDLNKVKSYLIASISRTLGTETISSNQQKILAYQQLTKIYGKTRLMLSEPTRDQLFREVMEELTELGPIQPLLDDLEVSEVMVNGPRRVYIERDGKLIRTEVIFEDDEHVLRIIDRLFAQQGRQIDTEHPIGEAKLWDGSRINAVIPPAAIDGPSFTIRKFIRNNSSVQDLIQSGALTESTAEFLRACVMARLNIIISGGIDTGKTTLLNILSSFIPDDDRIITIEDESRLLLQQENIVRLGTTPANTTGGGAVTIRELVSNSLRMRPDRIVISELNGGEAFDLLQAMNSGFNGIITTLQASHPSEVVSRLETLSLKAVSDWPIPAVRAQIVSGVDLILQLTNLGDGVSKLTQICEIAGMEGDTVVISDIFKFEPSGSDADGKVLGELKPTGVRPLFSNRLEGVGFKLRPDVFGVNIVEMLIQGLSREHKKPFKPGEV
jgi:pilus assembly protein CpaF